ncbi:hypothetical protein EMIT0P265_30477 [Pseudomonas zeae]
MGEGWGEGPRSCALRKNPPQTKTGLHSQARSHWLAYKISASTVDRCLFILKKFFLQQSVIRLAKWHHSGTWFTSQFAEKMLQGVLEFFGSAVDCLFQRIGLVGHGNRLMAFWPRFQLAAQVMGTWFVTVLVAQVDFDTGQVFFITFERALNGCTYPLLQSLTTLNMVIAVDLDLHSSSLISASS